MAMGFETECAMADGTPKLHPQTMDKVRFRMINQYDETIVNDEPIGTKTLFTSVMSRIHQLEPDVVLFPAYSALPLASAVRGFYEGIAQQAPRLSYIHASRRLTTPFDRTSREKRIQDEVNRLKYTVAGSSVVVLDHFVSSGGSLQLASELLEHAGATELETFPLVRWYGDLDDDERYEMNLDTMSYPRYDSFMRGIGRQAARYATLLPKASPQK